MLGTSSMTKWLTLLQVSPVSYDDKTKEACAEAHENKEEKAIGFLQALAIPVSLSLFCFQCCE